MEKQRLRPVCMLILLLALALPTGALAAWQDGLYQDLGEGYSGQLVVTVTIRDGVITGVEAQGRNGNTDDFLQTALEGLVPRIIQSNGASGIDTVTGATISSRAVLTGVEGVLKQAGSPPSIKGAGSAAPTGVAPYPTVNPATAQVFAGFGSVANFRVGPGKDDTGVQVYSFNIAMASCMFDRDGRILDAWVDVYEVATPNYNGASMPHFSGWPARQGYNITDPNTGKVTGVSMNTEKSIGDEVAAWITKRERGDGYGMNPANEWYKQMDAYQRWMVGKTTAELRGWFARYTSLKNGRPIKATTEDAEDQKMLAAMTDEEKAQLSDVVSMATMSLSDSHGLILEAVEKAYDNRTPVAGVGIGE